MEELKAKLDAERKRIDGKYDNINTRRKHYTKFRSSIKKKYGLHSEEYTLARRTFGIGIEDAKKFSDKESKRIEDTNNRTIILSDSELNEKIPELAKSSDRFDNLVAVGVATGARLIELLQPKISKFEVSSDEKGYIIQTGTAKNSEQKTLVKPTLILSPSQVVDLIKSIRKQNGDVSDISNERLTSRYSRKIRNALVRAFPRTDTMHNKMHFLRRVYANAAFNIYANGRTRNAFIKEVLGHKSLETSLSYNNVEVTKSDDVAALVDREGNTVEVEKVPIQRDNSDETKKERLRLAIKLLDEKNVKPTIKNIMKLRFSQITVSKFRKEL